MLSIFCEDENLVEQAKTDPAAFGRLYECYVDRIYSYVFYRVGSHEDAEDLTARTFYQALDKIGSYEQRGAPFSAWLYRIAHNLIANWHRQHARHPVLSFEDIPLPSSRASSPAVVVEKGETRSELLAAIRRLPADRQQLIILKFVERLPNAEIGRVMGRTESSIKSLYHRTLQSLRTDLQDKGIL